MLYCSAKFGPISQQIMKPLVKWNAHNLSKGIESEVIDLFLCEFYHFIRPKILQHGVNYGTDDQLL